jgi:putative tryptophan/tyrosine transport system ATP-binding protein
MIKIDDLDFKLPNGQTIIKDLSCHIQPQDFIVLLGGNGSGKSTLIKCLNRYNLPSKGTITFDDVNIHKLGASVFAKKVITLTQFVRESLFFDLTIAENAYVIETAYDSELRKQRNKKLFREKLKSYLLHFNPTLANNLDEPLYNLSGGEQQILAFALYLQHQPEILLLDEHTSALDPKTADKVMKFTADIIKEKKLTCIMATHNLDFALEYGNRVIALNEGKIVYDSVGTDKASINRSTLLEKCY